MRFLMMIPLYKQPKSLYLAFCFVAMISTATKAFLDVSFQQNYKIIWGAKHHIFFPNHGREVLLLMDKSSGAGFRSKLDYASGFFQMKIKIPKKDSRGIVTAFYLASKADNGFKGSHDELDFEFLGNNGEPYVLQTNIFARDAGGREQRLNLWFDPTTDFHTYGILWNQHQIVFYVDKIPVRVFKNKSKLGVNFPSHQMHLTGSIWNGEPWASNGKRIDWTEAPFIAHFQGFKIHGCQSPKHHDCYSSHLWWNHKRFWQLDSQQQRAYEDVRRKYLLYDYCSDRGKLHKECQVM
ncbi:hypothetical protein L6164_003220 [Bauhinia variegata]|uniref:Uncharacterized protein n=1 Tax=Bauhinia variegata TaxID=167791 RepID=A0ACB9Q650_BAUVA|nr:hypothetical protein L6164_003220 [Bauhinia variegata]